MRTWLIHEGWETGAWLGQEDPGELDEGEVAGDELDVLGAALPRDRDLEVGGEPDQLPLEDDLLLTVPGQRNEAHQISGMGMDVSGSSGFMHVASITHCFLEAQLGQTRNNEQKLAENMNEYRIE